MIKDCNAFLVSLTETHLKERILDNEINIEGFQIIRADRSV